MLCFDQVHMTSKLNVSVCVYYSENHNYFKHWVRLKLTSSSSGYSITTNGHQRTVKISVEQQQGPVASVAVFNSGCKHAERAENLWFNYYS